MFVVIQHNTQWSITHWRIIGKLDCMKKLVYRGKIQMCNKHVEIMFNFPSPLESRIISKQQIKLYLSDWKRIMTPASGIVVGRRVSSPGQREVLYKGLLECNLIFHPPKIWMFILPKVFENISHCLVHLCIYNVHYIYKYFHCSTVWNAKWLKTKIHITGATGSTEGHLCQQMLCSHIKIMLKSLRWIWSQSHTILW